MGGGRYVVFAVVFILGEMTFYEQSWRPGMLNIRFAVGFLVNTVWFLVEPRGMWKRWVGDAVMVGILLWLSWPWVAKRMGWKGE